MKYITRTIWILSLVSLLTDVASEMLYPIMPLYLESIGFTVVLIGILEGLAEATAGLSKGYFGKLSDASGERVPFVRLGYGLSAISKPLLAMFVYPLWIFFARTLDRFGKGIRTSARDAILSEESTTETKGRVFGFHRAMDTFGAVLGPSTALIFLIYKPGQYRLLFYIAFIPGLLAVLATFLLKDKVRRAKEADKSTAEKPEKAHSAKKVSFFSFLRYWRDSPAAYKKLIIGLLVFTLFNSSDVFLLLKAKSAGLSDLAVIGVYIFYNLIYALTAFPMGILADRIGLKTIFVSGLALFAVVYFGMAVNSNLAIFFVLFFIYGLYAATSEGISKAWITNIVDKKDLATAVGTFSAFQSICTMLASFIAGLVWYQFGATFTFAATSIVTVLVIFYFWLVIPQPNK